MNDLDLLRELLPPAAPPSAQAIESARARISRPGRPSRTSRSARGAIRRPRTLVTGLAAATLAAAAPAFVIAAPGTGTGTGTGTGKNGRPPVAPVAAPTARTILLTAARNAAAAPATGSYWRIKLVSGGIIAAGPDASPFAVEQRWTPAEYWFAASPSGRTWTLPAAGYTSQPASPGASAAWRADGSPALPASSGPQEAWWRTGGAIGYFGNSNLTLAQFQALPSDPAQLAAAVTIAAQGQVPPGFSVTSGDQFSVYTQLLKLDPISPQVRSAVFENLAALPGVESIGTLTDPLGRTGYGITLTAGGRRGQTVLVINSRQGSLLAEEMLYPAGGTASAPSGAVPGLTSCPAGTRPAGKKGCFGSKDGKPVKFGLGPALALAPGQIQWFDAVLESGWTDAAPSLPPVSQQFSETANGKG